MLRTVRSILFYSTLALTAYGVTACCSGAGSSSSTATRATNACRASRSADNCKNCCTANGAPGYQYVGTTCKCL
jgi:hypothetical protein